MKHRSKVEVWLFAAILYVVGVLAAGGNRWIGGPVLLVLLLIALPQEYVTAPEALRVRAGLTRWAIPYNAITFVGESSLGPVLGKRVAVRIGRDSEILLAPDDPGAFFADGRRARSAPEAPRRRAGGGLMKSRSPGSSPSCGCRSCSARCTRAGSSGSATRRIEWRKASPIGTRTRWRATATLSRFCKFYARDRGRSERRRVDLRMSRVQRHGGAAGSAGGKVWPAVSRCFTVTPAQSTRYTLTADQEHRPFPNAFGFHRRSKARAEALSLNRTKMRLLACRAAARR